MIKAALTLGFRKMEEEVLHRGTQESWKDGCCVVLSVIVNNCVYVANLGDSKAILCRQADPSIVHEKADHSLPAPKAKGSYKAKSASISLPALEAIKRAPRADAKCLTRDYTCKLVAEKQRIEAAGGKIENGRINGIMEVSRSFGDLALKAFGVTSTPDLRVHFRITERDEFMLIACDGLWERYNEVVDDAAYYSMRNVLFIPIYLCL
jgi:integrin-linked kinase-associated serine/threonine phosphatase 2C